MDLWRPPHESEHQLAWWAPLVLASRAARRERIPWAIHVDEFELRGRVDRRSRPSIWIYAHRRAGELALDDTGQPYRFIATPRAASIGQFRPCAIRRAIWMARLPDVVAPVWYSTADAAEPARRPRPTLVPASDHLDDGHDLDDEDDDDLDDLYHHGYGAGPGVPVPGARRRSHLAVIDGGRLGA